MIKESIFQTRFNKWVKARWNKTALFELKVTSKPLPFNAVLQHQKDALVATKHRSLIFKIPDDSRSYKPADCFCLAKEDAYVVIMYYELRKSTFIMIDIDDFLEEEKNSDRKSLTEDRAREIGIECSFK